MTNTEPDTLLTLLHTSRSSYDGHQLFPLFYLIVQAKSGTGKTLVFTIIALEMLLETNCPQVLILAPTREIAVQICDVITAVGSEFEKLRCNSFIGGLPVSDDQKVAHDCQIAVGTPGRIKQLISSNILRTNAIRLFVLDEADELLQPSFKSDINDIFKMLPKEKQVIATSATYPDELKKLAQLYFKEPHHARLNINELSLLGMVHYFFIVPVSKLPVVAHNLKLKALKDILLTIKFSQCLVFCNMISRVDSLCFDIKSWGFSTTYISSAKLQSERLKAIKCLKKFQCKVLVSSDVTSRGSKCFVSHSLAKKIDSYKKMQAQGHFKSFLLPDPVPSNLISIMPPEQSVEDNGFDKSELCNSNEEQNREQNLDDCNQNKTDGYNQLLDENKSIPEKYLDSSNSTLVDYKKSYSSSENIDENSVEIDICHSPSESGDSQAEIENSCSISENIHENSMETDICLCLSEYVDSQVKNEKLSAALSTLEEQNLELNLFEDKIKSVNNENKPGLECNDTVMESTCETNKKIVEETGGETFSSEIISLIPDITCQELKPSEPTTERQLETDLKPSLTTFEMCETNKKIVEETDGKTFLNEIISPILDITCQELKSSEPITEMQLKTGLKPSLTTSESVVNDELSELASEGGLKSKKNKNSKAKADNSNVPNINLEENMSSVTDFINNYEKDGSNVQSPKGNFNLGDFMSTKALPLNTYIPNLRSNLNQYYYNTYKEFKQDIISNSLVNQLNDSLSDDKKIQQEIEGANVHSASYGTSRDIWFDTKYLVESLETAVTQFISVNSDHGSILTASDNSNQQTPENNREQTIEHEKASVILIMLILIAFQIIRLNKSRFSMSKIPIPKGSTKLANNTGSENSRKSTSKQILEINNIKNKYEELHKNLKSFKNGDEKSVTTNINLISGNEVENKQKPMNKISTEEMKSVASLDTESSSESESSENEVEGKQTPINKISTEKIKSGATSITESSSESKSSKNAGKQLLIHNKTKSKRTTFNETDSNSSSPKLMSTGSNRIIFNKGEMSHDSDSSDEEMQFKLLEHAFQALMKKRGKCAEARNEKIKSYLHEIERLKLSSRESSIAETSMSSRSSSRCGSQKKYEPKGEFPRKVKPIQKRQTRPSSRLQNQYEAHPQLSRPYYQYGQPQPLYNKSVPQFSQSSHQYAQPQPLYNQSVPQFSQPSLQYAQPSPRFIQPNPQQTFPSPRFIQPSSQHTQLGSQYVQPGSLYSQFGYGPQFMPPSVQDPHISSRCHHSSCCCSCHS
ncbi:probable ATP-dependent RNA helicase DDX20 [Trichonephila inaurata madagascariensis]|uniref:RNA helicase n=1 Tax=Trichonephila inaurata madagascariensis TaxID=2747483 RepID=A0A8X6WYV5_9ARAC|nr:probable ATP-dependent RNA helicase DDX20 [Trichonephila inaurata madagascariensis]